MPPIMVPLILLLASQAAPPPTYWGPLEPGPHAVGFSQRWLTDSTRLLPGGERHGLRYRPILLNLWYPAARPGREPMRYDDYFEGTLRAARHSEAMLSYARALISYQRGVAWGELAGAERGSTAPPLAERMEALLRARTAAFRDAERSPGALPVVIYTQGAQSSMDDNVVLCEYLASLGYLVVGSAFPKEDNEGFATDASDGSRQRDIRRLLRDVALLPGAGPGPVTLIGHSAGAQVMQLFASDASAPIDAGISLDTTQDYAMLTDDTWAYYTDSVISRRRQVRIPIMFVAGPDALFELADSLVRSRRTLVTVPDVRHNEFISQGVIRKQVHAGLTGDDPTGRDAAARAYVALVGYIGSWLAARAAPTDDAPAASLPLQVAHVPPGEVFPLLDEGPPRSARQLRHLFGVAAPGVLAERVVQARKTHPEAVSNQALMMLLVHTVRRGDAARARAIYDALAALEPDVSRVPELIEARATLFERIGASVEAAEWRNLLKAFAPRL